MNILFNTVTSGRRSMQDESGHSAQVISGTAFSLRLQNIWSDAQGSLVLKLQSSQSEDKKSVFLLIDLRQAPIALLLSAEKPAANLIAEKGAVPLLRRFLNGKRITNLQKANSLQDYKICLHSGGEDSLVLLLRSSRPPEGLVHLGKNLLLRFSKDKTYTNRRELNEKELEEGSPWRDVSLQELAPLNPVTEPSVDALESCPPKDEARLQKVSSINKTLRAKIKRRLKTLAKSMARVEQEWSKANENIEAKNLADNLKQYSYLLSLDCYGRKVKLARETTGLETEVSLDLSEFVDLGDALRKLYGKSAKAARAFGYLEEQKEKIGKELSRLKQWQTTLQSGEDLGEEILKPMLRFFKLSSEPAVASSQRKSPDIPSTFRVFKISDRIVLQVGKSAKNNDELTRGAKSNDYWFHAVGIHGSHVVVSGKISEEDKEKVLRAAAILALHYSDRRGDMAGEVYCAQKSNLKKSKGMPPGKWQVLQAETLYVRYSNEELQALLATKV